METRHLDLKVRRAHDGSVSVQGDSAALGGLGQLLDDGVAALVAMTAPTDSPEPYQEWLRRISIEPELAAGLLIVCEGDLLVVRGGRASLRSLAENIRWFADQPPEPKGHIHIEYFPGHFYIREGSIPVVVARN